ncbi:MAG: hypothetical protein AB7I79_08730 [Rhizobiaceae bacterium]
MPRSLASYSTAEWLRLRPLSQAYKSALWDRIDRRYSAMPHIEPSVLEALHRRLDGRNFVATIAWNSPWTIRWLLRFVAKNLSNATFLVADNSSNPTAREDVSALCSEFGAAYVRLPPNPYAAGNHPSRSHGLALNWVYRHVVRRLEPEAWGFFDHDLYPTAPFDPAERLRGQPLYGHLEQRRGGAYLWPGYALYSSKADVEEPLDFRQDWFLGLDTGGMGARLIARHRSRASLAFARTRSIGPDRNFAVTIDDLDWLDDCVHLGNASGWLKPNSGREEALDALLERVLAGDLKGPFG